MNKNNERKAKLEEFDEEKSKIFHSSLLNRELSSSEEEQTNQSRPDKCLKQDFYNTDAISLSRNLLGIFFMKLLF